MCLCHDKYMTDIDVIDSLHRKFNRIKAELNERGRRLWAACEALELGHGGIKTVAQATGLGERTVRRGCREVRQEAVPSVHVKQRARSPGAGRKPLTEHDSDQSEPFDKLRASHCHGAHQYVRQWILWSLAGFRNRLKMTPHYIEQTGSGQDFSHAGEVHG